MLQDIRHNLHLTKSDLPDDVQTHPPRTTAARTYVTPIHPSPLGSVTRHPNPPRGCLEGPF